VRCDILDRHRYTVSQTGLNPSERSRNVSGAFSCRAPTRDAYATVRGRHVLLIDDVATTGATLRACSFALRELGPRSVWALTLARAA
jgi:predicted amidophosphoribosyltransferase